MERKKSPPIFFCVSVALMTYVAASPAQNVVAGKFQEVVQQQNFLSILTSIEERLKSLDNIYTMQLSQTLETKLDHYSRRIEALDTKIIRLEALVMFNLDKISENISTKNFKDDMGRTSLLRKMDSVYEGLNHRLGYMERKYETNLAKIQEKVESTLTRIDKIEENITTRDTDIEAEVSDAIFALDDLKTTCTTMEEKLYNISTAVLNDTQNTYKYLTDMNIDTRKSMNVLHDNIIESLMYINNKTLRHFKLVEDNNLMLKSMKTELKEDFNDYASKVADMSSYMWKNSDTTDDDLKRIETFVNNTKTEVQNGMRSLMLQIGANPFEDLNKNLKTNFQRILTNQDIFLESCHRLQMDEAQIESEISVTLENLIDMIEKKMAAGNDIKNLERALKTHDSRIIRNVHQINTNVIALFEKYNKNNGALTTDVKKIGNSLNDLLKSVSPTHTKILQDKLDAIENMILALSGNQSKTDMVAVPGSKLDELKDQILQQLQTFSKSLSSIESHVYNTSREENLDRIMHRVSQKYFYNCTERNSTHTTGTNKTELDDSTKQAIMDIFGSPGIRTVNPGKTNCKNSNTRSWATGNCGNTQQKDIIVNKRKKKKKKKTPLISLIDVRGNFGSEDDLEYEDDVDETTTIDTTTQDLTEETSTIETIINEDIFEAKPNDTTPNI